MISFIVIGKNEDWRLSQCLSSIASVVQEDCIQEYEILYVDSKSTDDSVHRALIVAGVRVFQITGECNAAIGRNIGAKEAKGNILFFIDGDMEIQSGYLPKVLNSEGKLTYPFVSGIYEDVEYDENWRYVETKRRYKLSEGMADSYETTTGGLFLIEKTVWESIGGMDTRLKRSQDLDLGLRMAKRGTLLLRKPFLLAKHHTQSYMNIQRNKIMYTSARYTGILARKHIFNPMYRSLFVRSQYSAISLFFSLLLSIIFLSPSFLMLYALVWLLKSFKLSSKTNQALLHTCWLLFCRDLMFSVAFFCSYPSTIEPKYGELFLTRNKQ